MTREDYIGYLEEDYYRRKTIENQKLLEIQKDILNKQYGDQRYFPEETLLRSKLLNITEENISALEVSQDMVDNAEVVDELEIMEQEEQQLN